MLSTRSAGWLVDRHDATRAAAASVAGMAVAFVALGLLAGTRPASAPASVAVGGAGLVPGPAVLALVAAGFEVTALTVLATTSPVLRLAARHPESAVEE